MSVTEMPDEPQQMARAQQPKQAGAVVRPARAVELGLQPHPEGGWYRRTWMSDVTVDIVAPDGSTRTRPTATLILFLLPPGECSAWHRVSSTETWIWNGLAAVTIELGGTGETPAPASTHVLGGDGDAGEHLQVTIAPGVWQRTLPAASEALASCVVSPGFDFADFSLEPAALSRTPNP
jgi:predicted cupin superfamily sugar epimerase